MMKKFIEDVRVFECSGCRCMIVEKDNGPITAVKCPLCVNEITRSKSVKILVVTMHETMQKYAPVSELNNDKGD